MLVSDVVSCVYYIDAVIDAVVYACCLTSSRVFVMLLICCMYMVLFAITNISTMKLHPELFCIGHICSIQQLWKNDVIPGNSEQKI